MSRVAKNPVTVPDKVEVGIAEGLLTVKGPLGTLKQQLTPDVELVRDAGGGKPRFQRRFQHVAGNTRVLADQHGGPGFCLFQYASHSMRQAHHKVGGYGGLANRAADAVGAEIFSCHGDPNVLKSQTISIAAAWR